MASQVLKLDLVWSHESRPPETKVAPNSQLRSTEVTKVVWCGFLVFSVSSCHSASLLGWPWARCISTEFSIQAAHQSDMCSANKSRKGYRFERSGPRKIESPSFPPLAVRLFNSRSCLQHKSHNRKSKSPRKSKRNTIERCLWHPWHLPAQVPSLMAAAVLRRCSGHASDSPEKYASLGIMIPKSGRNGEYTKLGQLGYFTPDPWISVDFWIFWNQEPFILFLQAVPFGAEGPRRWLKRSAPAAAHWPRSMVITCAIGPFEKGAGKESLKYSSCFISSVS